ncbi:MAG: hypothetical protein WCI00_07645 [bacterium]
MKFYLEKKDLFGFYKEVNPMRLYGKKFRFCCILMDSLGLLRKKIDDIDGRIIDLFVERFSIVIDI